MINVQDSGAADAGTDFLTINGMDAPDTQTDDTFLLRKKFVARLNDADTTGKFQHVERVNYDENINGRLTVNGLGGMDSFFIDDNSSITTVDGGSGADFFQIGQVFGTLRTAAAGVLPGDEFDTTPVIIGVVQWTDASEYTFNPSTQEFTAAIRDAINAAITAAKTNGQNGAVPGIGYVSNGVSYATTIAGGTGDDTFSVYHNKAPLRLTG